MCSCLLLVAGAAALPTDEATTVLLNNGLRMPKVSFAAQLWDAATCERATHEALAAGFTFVWSSFLVGGACQTAQRKAIDAAGAREKLFLAGTVDTQSCISKADCYEKTLAGARAQFEYLGPEPLEQIMLDYPSASCDGIAGQWQAFTELYNDHKVKSIAVSNFGETELSCLFANHSTVPPVANQLRYSVGQTGGPAVLARNMAHGIIVQAYSPLGSGSVLQDPTVLQIAKAHAKSAAQVALRYILQKNVTVATQSTDAAHLKQDLDLFDWALTADEMKQLDAK